MKKIIFNYEFSSINLSIKKKLFVGRYKWIFDFSKSIIKNKN